MSIIVEMNNNNSNHLCHTHDRFQNDLRELTKTFRGIEKPLKNAKEVNSLSDLIAELNQVFSGEHVNIEYVNHLLLSFKSNPSEWKKFAKFDRYRYTRNLVDAGNGKFNLMILCWGEGHSSAIHDHANSHCFMKMLKGSLCEVRYAWPSENSLENDTATLKDNSDRSDSADINLSTPNDDHNELQELSRCILNTDGVCYINDTLGLHRVENASHTDVAISMHLYCPPFDSCSVFNKETGQRTSAQITFWSKYGERKEKNQEMFGVQGQATQQQKQQQLIKSID